MSKRMPSPTNKEIAAIRELKRLASDWPKGLWLFSASGTLHVMKYLPDGEKAVHPSRLGDGGIDQDYSIETIDIPNDGGDW